MKNRMAEFSHPILVFAYVMQIIQNQCNNAYTFPLR